MALLLCVVEYDAITCKLLTPTTARSEITNIMALVKLFQILITLCSAMKDMMWTTDERRRTWCMRQKHFTLQFSICGGEARGESNYPELPGPGEPHYIVKLGEDGQTCRPCLAMLWRIQY